MSNDLTFDDFAARLVSNKYILVLSSVQCEIVKTASGYALWRYGTTSYGSSGSTHTNFATLPDAVAALLDYAGSFSEQREDQ